MRRILFVANGNGESAIAARIAAATHALAATSLACDLFPLVGTGPGLAPTSALCVVGPRRIMPSGGLVAMGNLRAFASDLRAGFAALFAEQLAFLVRAHAWYDAIVAVGDAFALAMALVARRPTVFVGTAKSLYVAPYGPGERALLRRASRIFVRDEATAALLRKQGVAARAPGNVIADLATHAAAPAGRNLGILPGSRMEAYADGVRLARVARALGRLDPHLGALFSVAPTLDAARFAGALAADGWSVTTNAGSDVPFEARAGAMHLRAWTGDLGSLLGGSTVVLGQAGTGNEQAAAFGVPVVALDDERAGASAWYRMRQGRLLGDALALVPEAPDRAASAIARLLGNPARLASMASAGRARMGAPGGARVIAAAIADVVS
jgi:uncharacterized protein (TIGR03492 family)